MAHVGQTLENPASGERITFVSTAADTGGELLAIDLRLPPGRRVPGGLHVHPRQEERFAVMDGAMRFRLGRDREIAGPGDIVFVPAGVAHDFACEGPVEALVRVEIRPALRMELLLETVVELAKRGRTTPGGLPRPLELALLVREFNQEVRAPVPGPLVSIALAPLAAIAVRTRWAELVPYRGRSTYTPAPTAAASASPAQAWR